MAKTRKNIKRAKSRKTKRSTHMKGGDFSEKRNVELIPKDLPFKYYEEIIIKDISKEIDTALLEKLYYLISSKISKIDYKPNLSEYLEEKFTEECKILKNNLYNVLDILARYYDYLNSKFIKSSKKIHQVKINFLIFLQALNFLLHMNVVLINNSNGNIMINTNNEFNNKNNKNFIENTDTKSRAYSILKKYNITRDLELDNESLSSKVKDIIVRIVQKIVADKKTNLKLINNYPIQNFKLLLQRDPDLCLEFLTLPLNPDIKLPATLLNTDKDEGKLKKNDILIISKFINNAMSLTDPKNYNNSVNMTRGSDAYNAIMELAMKAKDKLPDQSSNI